MVRFRVTGTSRTYGPQDDSGPCEEARIEEYTRIDIRTADDPTKIPAYGGESEWWYKEGENHRVVDGEIVRDFPHERAWFVHFSSLEELLRFVEKYGDVFIDWEPEDEPEIQIDDYRE